MLARVVQGIGGAGHFHGRSAITVEGTGALRLPYKARVSLPHNPGK